LIQAFVALLVAGRIKRLGEWHGLFAAFVAACVSALGVLGLNLLFGGTMTPGFSWTVFSSVSYREALLTLPAVVVAGAFSQHRDSAIKSLTLKIWCIGVTCR